MSSLGGFSGEYAASLTNIFLRKYLVGIIHINFVKSLGQARCFYSVL